MDKRQEMWKNALNGINEDYITEAAELIRDEAETVVSGGNKKSSGNLKFVIAAAAAVLCCFIGISAFSEKGGMKEIPISPASGTPSAEAPEDKIAALNYELNMAEKDIAELEMQKEELQKKLKWKEQDIKYVETQRGLDEERMDDEDVTPEMKKELENSIASWNEMIAECEKEAKHLQESMETTEEFLSEAKLLRAEIVAKLAALNVEVITTAEITTTVEEAPIITTSIIEETANGEGSLETVVTLVGTAESSTVPEYFETDNNGDVIMQDYSFTGETGGLLSSSTTKEPISPEDCPIGMFGNPLDDMTVTGRYGYDQWTGSFRHGVSFGNRDIFGAPIYAVADGRVEKVVKGLVNEYYGDYIVIDHGDGLKTLYAHCRSMNVTVGQEVKEGDVIGNVGGSGWAAGACLGFEVYVNGQTVDPMPCFRESGKRTITKADVLELSEKGDSAVMADFDRFFGRDIGSGIYIMQYTVDENIVLTVSYMSHQQEKPDKAVLTDNRTGAEIELKDCEKVKELLNS